MASGEMDLPNPDAGKNPTALASSCLCARKGGKARAESLQLKLKKRTAKKAALGQMV
jgi:hypothetical protein